MVVDTRDLVVPTEEEFQGLGELLDLAWMAAEPRCRVCACTESRACLGGCCWLEPGLCSSCAEVES